MAKPHKTTAERFWEKVAKAAPNECWMWLPVRPVAKIRAGSFWCRGRHVVPSRYVLEQKVGRRLSSEEHARHTCGNERCVNPAHLYLSKGKPNDWTPEEIAQVKVWYCQLKWTAAQVARKTGLSPAAVAARLRRLGLRNGKSNHFRDSIDHLVKKCHLKGMNDTEAAEHIGRVLGRDVYGGSVKRRREVLGLPSNYDREKHRQKIINSIRKSMADHSAAATRYERERQESASLGFPSVTAAARTFLEYLEKVAAGATMEMVAAAVGLRSGSARAVLRTLRNSGWVVSDRKIWRLSDPVKELRRRWETENRIRA